MGSPINRSRTQELFSTMVNKLDDLVKLLKTQNELLKQLIVIRIKEVKIDGKTG